MPSLKLFFTLLTSDNEHDNEINGLDLPLHFVARVIE